MVSIPKNINLINGAFFESKFFLPDKCVPHRAQASGAADAGGFEITQCSDFVLQSCSRGKHFHADVNKAKEEESSHKKFW